MTKPRMPVVLRLDEVTPRDRGGGVRTRPLVTGARGATGFLNGITEFAPGAAVPLHFHNCDEAVLLLEGEGSAFIDGVEHEVRPGDTTLIPAGVHHFFRNRSSEAPMRIFWTYGSVDATRTLVETGVTTRIDQEHGAR